jgi:hypothetical protein
MTKHEYRTGPHAPGLTLAAAAKVLHVASRNSRAFALGEPRVPETDHARTEGPDSALGQPA